MVDHQCQGITVVDYIWVISMEMQVPYRKIVLVDHPTLLSVYQPEMSSYMSPFSNEQLEHGLMERGQ